MHNFDLYAHALHMQQPTDLSFYTFVCMTGKPCNYVKYLIFS